MAVVFEYIVTLIFWTALYDGSGDFNTFAAHILPCTLLTIDFACNRIYVDFMQFIANLIILTLYGMVNLIATKAMGYPVYPIMEWNSFTSVLIAFAMLPLMMLFWTLAYYVSKCKFAKCGKR